MNKNTTFYTSTSYYNKSEDQNSQNDIIIHHSCYHTNKLKFLKNLSHHVNDVRVLVKIFMSKIYPQDSCQIKILYLLVPCKSIHQSPDNRKFDLYESLGGKCLSLAFNMMGTIFFKHLTTEADG